jgi:hypothetical protein
MEKDQFVHLASVDKIPTGKIKPAENISEQIGQFSGEVTGQRVIDVEGPLTERTVSLNGTIKGVEVTEMATIVVRPVSAGVFWAEEKGVVMKKDSDMATFKGYLIGRINSTGTMSIRGSLFFSTKSVGSPSFLNNLIGLLEIDVDSSGKFSEKLWEWK